MFSIQAAKGRLKQVITQAGDKEIAELCSRQADIESATTGKL